MLFRNQSGDKVKAIMDDIQKDIYEKDFIYNDTLLNVSISVGVSEIREEKSLKDIIDKVDKNLYVAKANGKNQVFYM
ncbi:GGDEF domain-containing protein [Lactococcus garvieae]|uniref:GGDEF domain-containing protein n=1 Tax=Lactococcus garvieae TaxID=1363 RepID=UPI003854805B